MRKLSLLLFAVTGVMVGCGSEPSTAAPKVTGTPRPEWKTLSKEDKIALINKQPIPDQAKQEAIQRVNAGID